MMNKSIVINVILALCVVGAIFSGSIKLVNNSKPIADKYLIGEWHTATVNTNGKTVHADGTPHIKSLHSIT